MKLVKKVLARNRLRRARQALARNPSPRSYAALAQEYALLGLTGEVLRVCEEGLRAFPGHALLERYVERARRLEREERMAQLRRSLAEAPRPALYQEACELLMESGRLDRAEELAREWIEWRDGGPARLALARVRLARFFADRGREQGHAAHRALEEAVEHLPGDPAPRRLLLQFLLRIGAYAEAKSVTAALLELEPGAPELEARFRSLQTLVEDARPLDQALIEIERSGRLADDEREAAGTGGGANVRPILRELASARHVRAALYLRGATVLVQGPRGATAERTARAVRSILSSGRATARRLGLGGVMHLSVEGSEGVLALAPGELDAGAVWSRTALAAHQEEVLAALAGIDADVGEDET